MKEDYFDFIGLNIYELKKKNGLIIDTNILLLYIVGKFDIEWIKKFSRTEKYSVEIFSIIDWLISFYNKHIYISPQIISELSNISPEASKKNNKDVEIVIEYFKVFKEILMKVFFEKYIHKDKILNFPYLYKYGVTDLSIYKLAKDNNYLVVTDDFRLSNYLNKNNVTSINIQPIIPIFKK